MWTLLGALGLAGCVGEVTPVLAVHGAEGGPPPARPDTASRLRAAIAAERGRTVAHVDPLGEGPGALDPDPQGPAPVVDCVTWVQQVLARAVADGTDDAAVASALARIRYYAGVPGFGTRKHFVDAWLAWDPWPLRRMTLPPGASAMRVRLSPRNLGATRGYGGAFVGGDAPVVDVPYLRREDAVAWVRTVPPGVLLLSAVAGPTWHADYNHGLGEMGQTHLLFVDTTPSPVVWHASVSAGEVRDETLHAYVDRVDGTFVGFVPWAIVPEDPRAAPGWVRAEAARIAGRADARL